MNTLHNLPKNRESRSRLARIVKHRLSLLIGFLVVLLLAVLFRAGEAWWPVWIIEHQRQVAGIVILAILVLILLAPVIIEADSDPRPLDGPGKNPYL
jgi:hypothetical protein